MRQSATFHYSKNTPAKQASCEATMDLWLNVYTKIRNKCRWVNDCLWYIDLNAGKGVDDDGLEGSPLIFLRKVEEYGLNYQAYLYEYSQEHAEQLHNLCTQRNFHNFTVMRADNQRVLDDFPETKNASTQFGIVYSDVSNAPAVPIDMLEQLNKRFPRLDIMINLAFASYKRTVKHDDYVPLYNALPKIKKHWKVRKPLDKFQWSILLGLNWGQYPNQEAWGFYDFHSEIGKYYWNILTRTKDDLANGKQLPLWGNE